LNRAVTAYDAFAPVYDPWSGHMTEDVDFYVSLAAEADGPIVELAVGNGRVAVPIVERTGKQLIGIDLSPAMLDGARERAERAGVQLELRLGDIRELALEAQTDLVICPFRSLLHLERPEHPGVFRRVFDALRPGGRFAWNAFVFDPAVAAEIGGGWRVQNGIRHRVDYDFDDRRLDLTLDGGATVPLWWVEREEWDASIEAAGLEVEALYGWFDRSPFDEESREFVYVARRPA
jgi:SAM-dependent methyltransferase